MADLVHNPILRREFVCGIRRPVTAVLASLTVLVLGVVIYLLWPRSGVISEANSNVGHRVATAVNRMVDTGAAKA